MNRIPRAAVLVAICQLVASVAYGAATVHPPFAKAWTFRPGDQMEKHWLSAGIVYYQTLTSYGAVNLATGQQLWEEQDDRAGMVSDDNTAYVDTGTSIIARRPKSGDAIWKYPKKGNPGLVGIQGKTLYYDSNSTLTALDTRTRKPLWSVSLKPRPYKKNEFGFWACDSPLFIKGRLFVGTSAGEVLCISLQTGKVIWRNHAITGDYAFVDIRLAADANRVYFTSDMGDLRALNIATGKQVWRFIGKDNGNYGCPTVVGNLVVFRASTGVLYCVRASDGKKQWQATLSRKSQILLHRPMIVANQVLVTAGSQLMAYDLSGKQLWKWDCAEGLADYPVVPLDDGFIVAGYRELCRYRMDRSAGLTEDGKAGEPADPRL